MSLRALLEHGLNARWYGNTPPGPSARLLAYIYGRLRPKTRAQKPNRSLPVRVVVVGNLTVGGVGKTPLVIAIVRLATELGLRVGVIARGYGGHARGVVEVRGDSDWREVGDEPLLIKRLTQAPMVIGRRRLDAARALLALGPLDLIIADDGLQHSALPRDAEIVVIDGERGFGNGMLLPAGPLREPITRLESVDLCVYRGGSEPLRFDLELGEPWALADRRAHSFAELGARPRLVAMSGIGHPERFFHALRAKGLKFEAMALADHRALDGKQLASLATATVLTTEKDAVKYAGSALDLIVVPAQLTLSPALKAALMSLLKP